jgi:hypothetical protein
MSGRKRKQSDKPNRIQVRPRLGNNARWDGNEPENWSTAEPMNKLTRANIILPTTLKKSQLVQIYKDNVLNKDRRDATEESEEIQTSDHIRTEQNGDLVALPASSLSDHENEAGGCYQIQTKTRQGGSRKIYQT